MYHISRKSTLSQRKYLINTLTTHSKQGRKRKKETEGESEPETDRKRKASRENEAKRKEKERILSSSSSSSSSYILPFSLKYCKHNVLYYRQ